MDGRLGPILDIFEYRCPEYLQFFAMFFMISVIEQLSGHLQAFILKIKSTLSIFNKVGMRPGSQMFALVSWHRCSSSASSTLTYRHGVLRF